MNLHYVVMQRKKESATVSRRIRNDETGGKEQTEE
jgi:hypothetical protein